MLPGHLSMKLSWDSDGINAQTEAHCELEMTKPKMMTPSSISTTAMICSKELMGPTSP